MSEPKFKVGEEVIFRTEFTLWRNSFFGIEWHKKIPNPKTGESIVIAIGFHNNEKKFPWTFYKLKGHSSWFSEGCLFKKHKPGDSFESIMTAIRQPIGEKV